MSDHSHHSHNHGHNHNHSHHHSHSVSNYGKAFLVSILLNTLFVLIESGYGFLSHSLALIADAGHNLSDVLGLILAWVATTLAKRPPSTRRTFGLRRSSILAAFINAVFLLLVSGGICFEAVQRLQNPEPIAGNTVMIIAAIGIVINTISAFMFAAGSKEDLNIKGAFLHLISDALVSVGVVLAGAAIVFTGQLWVDPVMSLVISIIIILGTWQLFRESLGLLMDGVPLGIEPTEVTRYLSQLSVVTEVHDLHIWAMSTTENALMVHLVMPTGHPGDRFLAEVSEALEHQFNIHHTNLQIETGDPAYPCAQAPANIL